MDPGGGVLKFGRFELDLVCRELRHDGIPVELQRAPLDMLLYLAEHRDRVVSKPELLATLWGGAAVTDSSISSALNQIRSAVEDDGGAQRVVKTLRRRGYRFVAVAPPLATTPSWRRGALWMGGIAALSIVGALAVWWLGRASALPPIRSVAVLPLENLSGDPDQEYFADGMTDALIGELAKIGSLRVISRPSVMRYKGTAKSVPEIAAELGVEALIVGSVVREDTHIRINLQLVDGRSDAHVWSKTYEQDLRSVLALQGEVARGVATQMWVELTPDELSRLASPRTVKPEAYDAYMRAVSSVGASDLTGFEVWGPQAIEHLERAVELDPDIAPAWALLGQLYINVSVRDFSARDAPQKAREAVLRALELDDSFGPAHASLGHILRFYDWDFAAAEGSFEKAVELGPNDPRVLVGYAIHLGEAEGKTPEALALAERTTLLAPFSPSSRIWYGNILLLDGQCERALGEYERVRQLLPGWHGTGEAFCYAELGRFDEAYRIWLAVFERSGSPGAEGLDALERGWADGSWRGAMRAWVEAAAKVQYVNPATIAMVCSWVGETDDAFAWLERAYRVRDPMITSLKTVFFRGLRSDPRYDELVRRIGLPES